jgi:UDP-2,3-diacylglucosamine hydrolase
MSETVYFLSDAHLGALPPEAERPKVEKLLAFLKRMEGGDKTLYIVGDLFDFWFEYKTVVFSQHFRVLHALRQVVESGTRVNFICGNHDAWTGPFLREQVGLHVATGSIHTLIDGRHYFITHGDGLRPGEDPAYAFSRMLLRNRFTRFLFRQVHPDLGIRLARALSGWSRGNNTDDDGSRYLEILRDDIAKPLFQQGVDAVIVGHLHYPYHYRSQGKELLVLGDWMRHFTYGKLEDGQLTLTRWREDDPSRVERIPAFG